MWLGPGHSKGQAGLVAISGASQLEGRCRVSTTPQYGSEVEPYLVADPADRRRLVAVWQQDRYVTGGSLALAVSTSGDGGQTWQRRAVPGLTGCPVGGRSRNSDPWLAFGPDGRAYLVSVPGHISQVSFEPDTSVVVSHSDDGGITWSKAVEVAPKCAFCFQFNDKPAITADPASAGTAYVTW